ncbi:MAG: tail fiber protein, partial [Phaeodactylibacter sp.]|nr:tail fiber protein [Phaeodactylibacter sp.]
AGELGQISLFVGDQPSCAGWLPCDGRTLTTIEYQVLYQLTLPKGTVVNPSDVPKSFQLPYLSDTPASGMQYLIKVTGPADQLKPWDPDKDTGEHDGQTDWPPLQTMGIIDRYVQPQSSHNAWRLAADWIMPAGQLESALQFPKMFKFYGSRYGGDAYTTFAFPNLPAEDGGIPFALLPGF